ncbi:hypothetical protein ABIE35_002448 [Paenarthrobacter sp. 4246]
MIRPQRLLSVHSFRRSLMFLGFGVDALSRPSGLGRSLSHVPRVWGRRSLASLGFGAVALSRPSGLGWMLSHVPRVWSGVRRRWWGGVVSVVAVGWGCVTGFTWAGLGCVGVVLGLFSLCLRGFWVVLGWIWCGGVARVKLFESPPLMRKDGDRLPSNCRFRWCFCVLLVGVGGPGSGLLCAAGSGNFEKLLRSDPGPLWVWVVPVVSVV